MKTTLKTRGLNAFTILAIIILGATMMSAQASRTWVSGVGNDANPCSRTAPCKTFAGAYANTIAGGEIDVMDAGGFGTLTITHAITIDGSGGNIASVLAERVYAGITINAGANDQVILRNLSFDAGSSINGTEGAVGIQFNSGKSLIVENCVIFGFGWHGIDISLTADGSRVVVRNTSIFNIGNAGIWATTSTGLVTVGLDHVAIDNALHGVWANQHSRMTIRESVSQHNTGDGLRADDSSTMDAQLTIDRCEVTYNGSGIVAGTGSSVNVSDSKVAFNTNYAFNNGGGSFFTYQNNRVIGPNNGTISPAFQQ